MIALPLSSSLSVTFSNRRLVIVFDLVLDLGFIVVLDFILVSNFVFDVVDHCSYSCISDAVRFNICLGSLSCSILLSFSHQFSFDLFEFSSSESISCSLHVSSWCSTNFTISLWLQV